MHISGAPPPQHGASLQERRPESQHQRPEKRGRFQVRHWYENRAPCAGFQRGGAHLAGAWGEPPEEDHRWTGGSDKERVSLSCSVVPVAAGMTDSSTDVDISHPPAREVSIGEADPHTPGEGLCPSALPISTCVSVAWGELHSACMERSTKVREELFFDRLPSIRPDAESGLLPSIRGRWPLLGTNGCVNLRSW